MSTAASSPIHRAPARGAPLSAALRSLAPPAPTDGLPLGAFRILPRLLDFSGSVSLAGALSAPLLHPVRGDAPGEGLREVLEGRLADLAERMRPVFLGEVQVSSHVRMRRDLRNPPPSMDGSHPGVRAIRAPFARYVQGHVFDLRASLSTLRLELAPQIAAPSADAARLEALDAALRSATARETEVLMARLLAHLDAVFADLARAELLLLPTNFEASELEAWFLPDGWVPGYLRRVGGVMQALFQHEASLLRALVRASLEGSSS